MSWLAPTALNYYAVLQQIELAIMARRAAIDFRFGLRVSRVWFDGTSTPVPVGVTATSFTTTQTWRGGAGSGDPPYADPWNGHETDDYAPTSAWFLVFDHCNPDKVVKTRITGWTNAGQLGYADVTDFVTAGIIPSVASLAGRNWYIIRGDYGLWTSDRVIERPNAREWAKGTVAEYHDDPLHPATVTNPTTSSMKDAGNRWVAADVVGRDLLLYADDGFLKRVVVTDYADGVFYFAAQAWTPAVGSPYCVVETGKRAIPGRKPESPFCWFRGLRGGRTSAFLGASQPVLKPEQSIQLDTFDGTACTTETVRAFDRDVWTEDQPSADDLSCGRLPEKCYTPHFHTTIRALQYDIEDLSTHMVEMKSYAGLGARQIPAMRPARLFALLGLPAITLTGYSVVGTSGNAVTFASSIAGSLPYAPIKVHWLIDGPGSVGGGYGTGLLSASGLETAAASGGGDNFTAGEHDAAGCSITVAFGWDGFARREFAQMFPRTGWIADTDGVAAIDPPAIDYGEDGCNGLGYWFKRAASTHYLEARTETVDWSVEGVYLETGPAFADGELARYVGRNWANPAAIGIDGAPVNPTDPAGDYFGRMAVSLLAPADETARRKRLRGRATGGTPTQIWNTATDFWGGGGTLRVESGNASGGSTTTLVDSTKTAEPARCAWHATRFRGALASSWQGFALEVLMAGADFDDPAAVVEKALVGSGDETTGTLTWSVALSGSASGKAWRIREPRYEPNALEGRTVTVTHDDGGGATTVETRTILGNDDVTLFLDSPLSFTPDADTLYEIHDPRLGDVYRRVSGAWEVATGADAVRTGVTTPADFTGSPEFNLPDYVRRWGRYTFRDAACGLLMTRMQAALDLLGWVKDDAAWGHRDDPLTPLDNLAANSAQNGYAGCIDPLDGVCVADDRPGFGGALTYTKLHDERTALQNRWASGGSPSAGGNVLAEDENPPKAVYTIHRDYASSSETPNTYGERAGDSELVEASRRWNKLHTFLPALRPCGIEASVDVDWYGYSTVNEADTPDGSTGVDGYDLVVFKPGPINVQYRKWTLLDSAGGADAIAGGEVISGRIGEDLSVAPGAPPLPSDTPDADDGAGNAGPPKAHYAGFYVADKVAILKYSFPIPTP
jgi:hypothetical protein